LDSQQQTPPEAFAVGPTLAALSVPLKNSCPAISTGLESGTSQDFTEHVKEALAYALQNESEKENGVLDGDSCTRPAADLNDQASPSKIKKAFLPT
jgi:hypothetical protein